MSTVLFISYNLLTCIEYVFSHVSSPLSDGQHYSTLHVRYLQIINHSVWSSNRSITLIQDGDFVSGRLHAADRPTLSGHVYEINGKGERDSPWKTQYAIYGLQRKVEKRNRAWRFRILYNRKVAGHGA